MTPLAQALLAELDDAGLAELAARLAPYLPTAAPAPEWLGTKEAATYLGLSVSSVQKKAAARELDPHSVPGGRARFRRSELDDWAAQR